MQLQNTRQEISRLFKTLLDDTRGFKFIETLVVKFVTKIDGEYEIRKPKFNSKAQIVFNSNDFMETLQVYDNSKYLIQLLFGYLKDLAGLLAVLLNII